MLRTRVRRNLRIASDIRSQSGFTIMELLIVLTLIGILSAISMPGLKGFAATRRLKSSAAAMRSLLTFARDMAITDRAGYVVVLDFDTNRYWLASSETFNPGNPLASTLTAQSSAAGTARAQNPANTGGATATGVLSRTSGILGVPYAMEENVTLMAMIANRNGRSVEVDVGIDYIYFSPTSTSEEVLVYLQNSRNQIMSVMVEAASGRVSVRQLTSEEIELLGVDPSA